MEAEGLSVSAAGREPAAGRHLSYRARPAGGVAPAYWLGKTTLLETLLGPLLLADHGRAKLGHGVSLAYYSEQSLELPEQARPANRRRAWDEADRGRRDGTQPARFLAGDLESRWSAPSGGEPAAAGVARDRGCREPNLLVLDEPTTDLDIETREALEDALVASPALILFVSHACA